MDCLSVGTRDGIDLIAAASDAEPLGEALLGAGALEVSPEAVEILRVEAGVPRFGAEMGAETMPAEAGIVEAAVSFTKGCYIGQETVARLHYKGKPNRRLRGLRLERTGSAGCRPAPRRQGGRDARRRLRLPRPRPDRRWRSSAARPSPAMQLAVGEDGVTARVVDLPFG